jgi:hypothetical protein
VDGKPTAELADELRRLAASGRREEAATRFLETTGAPPEVIDMIKAGPHWPGMLALAHTLAYDITLSNGGVLPVARLAKIPVRTLALAGGAGMGWAVQGAETMAATIPDAEFQILSGQGHAPADEVLAPILRAFFTS